MVLNFDMGRIWIVNVRVILVDDFKVWGDGGYVLGVCG